ncbi:MAG TPA: hypothetical protein VEC11_01885 [Allosphingosinicella sp.]|nr:hypothetical protein [Allosphingosinicella sp.]
MKLLLPTLLLALSALQPRPQSERPEADFLRRCEADGRRLWGRSLCAPVVVVDPGSGDVRTTRPAPGPLPPLRANTAFDWAGERWIMVLAPLPGDPAALAELLFHEAWHGQQAALGFPANNVTAAHLDESLARYWLRLEWAALAEALASRGERQRRHIAQALAFRARRLHGRADAATAERALMRHEGLAAYTGAALSGDPTGRARAALAGGVRPGLGRSFAYASGPAWGLLLDRFRPGWRRSGSSLDLPEMMPVPAVALARPDAYGGTRLLSEEMQGGAERAARIAAAVAATAEGRGLRLPIGRMQLDYDPNRVSTAPDGSTIYHRITLRDQWGRISVEGVGLRILPDFSAAFSAWPLSEGALELAPGWRIESRQGGGATLVPPRR